MAKQPLAKPSMVECPECHVIMRSDQLRSHQTRVHSKNAPVTYFPPTPPGQRMCPVCKQFVPPEGYKEHLVRCMSLAKRKARKEAKPTPPSRPPQEISREKYITDEYGVVHTYDEWYKNETMGDHTEAQPSVEKGYIQRLSYKLPADAHRQDSRRIPGTTPEPVWVTCKICGARVLPRNLEKHRQKVHDKPGMSSQPIPPKPTRKPGSASAPAHTSPKPPKKP